MPLSSCCGCTLLWKGRLSCRHLFNSLFCLCFCQTSSRLSFPKKLIPSPHPHPLLHVSFLAWFTRDEPGETHKHRKTESSWQVTGAGTYKEHATKPENRHETPAGQTDVTVLLATMASFFYWVREVASRRGGGWCCWTRAGPNNRRFLSTVQTMADWEHAELEQIHLMYLSSFNLRDEGGFSVEWTQILYPRLLLLL